MSSDTQPVEVSYDENADPTEIQYHHMTFGLMKLSVADGVATLDPEWDRLGDKSLKDGYDRWVTTGDVLRSVEQLPFIERIEAPHHAPKEASDSQKEVVTDGGLYAKYEVRKDGEPVEDCFVLEPEDDSAAREALIRYAEETDDEALAEDLREWVTGLCTRGDVDG